MYQKMLRISWVEKLINLILMRRLLKEEKVILIIKKRKLLFSEHVTRGEKYQILEFLCRKKSKKDIQGKKTVSKIKITLLISNFYLEKI